MSKSADKLVNQATLKTLGEVIRRNAAIDPGAAAIVASGFSDLAYGDLAHQLDKVGVALRRAGFSREARIAIAVEEPARAALAIVAVAASAVAVPLDPNLAPVEIDSRLGLVGVDAVIVLAGEESTARVAAERRVLPVIEATPVAEGELCFDLAVSSADSNAGPSDPDPKAPAFILQTSGTTGVPNLIPYSHRNMLATAARVKRWFDLGVRDRCLSVSPVHYCHGLTVTVFAPLLSGGGVAFPFSPSRLDVGEWLDTLQPTWFSAGPTTHLAILDKMRAAGGKPVEHRLRFVVSGGAPLPAEVQVGLQTVLGVPVLEHYGATEAAQISANLPPPGPAKPGTCGRPDPDTVLIVGEDGQRLPPGERGEILVGGPTVISGYLNAPELNKVAFVDGWFRTGDVGSVDDEGFLTIHGRLKEIINRGGEKIAPVEIDVTLMRHPAVAEAAAFAVPHARLGEDVAAAVVLRPDASATMEELRKFLGERLAWYKVPRRISIVQELPKGNTGKVQRRRLSESYR